MNENKHIKYQKGFKYQLIAAAQFQLKIQPQSDIETRFINLSSDGVLTIRSGYAWDGPSGPTIDTRNFMRGSLIHDALYQLMRLELLPLEFKEPSDKELIRYCKKDGMSSLRAWWVYKGLHRFGTSATLPENKKDTLIAPI